MDRRQFLQTGFATLATSAAASAAKTGKFKFLHVSDAHIQPELRAVEGCRMCFDHAAKTRADFALIGGDLVFDAVQQKADRAKTLYGLFGESAKRLEMPVHATIGNHDVFGVHPSSGVDKSEPGFGKQLFEDKVGPRYRSFDHKGVHFVILDSIELTPDGGYVGGFDADQLNWMKSDLAKTGKTAPVIVLTHIPLVSAAAQILNAGSRWQGVLIRNAREVLDVLWQYNTRMVLQGHTHIVENVEYNGCQFITSGAVCGNWWKGKRLTHAEGYGLIEVANGNFTWSYRTYGFVADPPPPTATATAAN